jgi:hypothetical protein
MKSKIALFAATLAIAIFGLVPSISQASNHNACCEQQSACCAEGAACCE